MRFLQGTKQFFTQNQDFKVELKMTNEQIGYLIFRLTMGVNMFVHGANRIFGDWKGFVDGIVERFQATILPEVLTMGFAWSIPVIEFAVGVLLILGILTRYALALGGLLIIGLMFGMCLLQKWSVVGDQLLYAVAFFLLLTYSKNDVGFSKK